MRQANRTILTIDGSHYSGTATIVRQAVALKRRAESIGNHAAKQLLDEFVVRRHAGPVCGRPDPTLRGPG